MKKKLSGWSKTVKKIMIDQDMDINDLADEMGWTRQYTGSIVNGRAYYEDSVVKISKYFEIDIPSRNATLAKEVK